MRSRLRLNWRFPIFVAILLALTSAANASSNWEISTIDQSGTGNYSSLQIDSDGNLHVVYVADDGQKSLKYGFWDHKLRRWFTMLIASHASFCSLALDSKQRPHVSYVDSGTVIGAKLRYAHWDGKSWDKQALPLNADIITFYTSIAVNSQDRPSISYYEYEGAEGIGFVLRLRVVSWNGTYWEARTADEQPGSGKFNSIAIDSAGNIDVAYANVKAEHASLRYAQWNGRTWEHEILEGGDAQPAPMYSVKLVLDSHDVPHIAYSDTKNHLIKYATRRNGKWALEPVDVVREVGYPDRNGISLDSEGDPYISYYDEGSGLLKVAYKRNSKWFVDVVDANYSGYTSSIQIHGGMVYVTYADQTGRALKIAKRPVDETGSAKREGFPVAPRAPVR